MNTYFGVVLCCPISSKRKNYAGFVQLKPSKSNGLNVHSEIITFQVRSLSKKRLGVKLGTITKEEFQRLHEGLWDVLRV